MVDHAFILSGMLKRGAHVTTVGADENPGSGRGQANGVDTKV
jgi:hypothetical protein